MRDLYFKNIDELEDFLFDKKVLGKGYEGTCYKVEDFVLKVLLEEYRNKCQEQHYLKFRNIDIDNFNFIKNIAYINDKNSNIMIGTISKYIKGMTLDLGTLHNVAINDIIIALEQLIPSIRKLSASGIRVDDIFVRNIVFCNNKFNFIDTNSYFFTDEEPYFVYKENIIEIMSELMLCIMNSYNDLTISKFLEHSIYNYNIDHELLMHPIKYLKELKSYLENFCDREIICFNDSVPILKKKLQVGCKSSGIIV